MEAIVKLAHKRLLIKKKVRKFGTSRKTRVLFYTSVLQSVLNSSVIVCFAVWPLLNNKSSKITGHSFPSLFSIDKVQLLQKAPNIIREDSQQLLSFRICTLGGGSDSSVLNVISFKKKHISCSTVVNLWGLKVLWCA